MIRRLVPRVAAFSPGSPCKARGLAGSRKGVNTLPLTMASRHSMFRFGFRGCVRLLLLCAYRRPASVRDNRLVYGRTDHGHRFDPLHQINERTVARLGLAWSRELGTTRGLEATPLVKDS
jgi:hypothetical protein